MIQNINSKLNQNNKLKYGKDVHNILYENCKLYSAFTTLLYNFENKLDSSCVLNHHQIIQGIQGSQKEKEMIKSQALFEAEIKYRYQQFKKNLSIVNMGCDTAISSISSTFKLEQMINPNKDPELFFRVIKEKSEVYDIITLVMGRQLGYKWRELPHGIDLTHSWNLLWTWSKIKSNLDNLLVWQRFNHFPENKQITRKDLLKKNIEKLQKLNKKTKQLFDIIPLTFSLPQEYSTMLSAFHLYEKQEGYQQNYWIVKPPGKSRGRGIYLVNDLESLKSPEPLIVQKYLKNPLLINGHKFDMRIYVLVTSFNPLEVFLYKEGFARFSTVPFSLDPSNKSNKLMHLTNYSIQKSQFNYSTQGNQQVIQEEKTFNARQNGWIGSAFKSGCSGSKLSLSNLRAALIQKYISWDNDIWPQIKEIVIKSLIAGQYNGSIPYNPCAFELYGYDIIIDSKKKCWLIEVNSSPSLATETHLDETIKRALIKDSINLLDPLDFDRQRLAEVLQRRLNENQRYNSRINSQQQQTIQMNRDLTYILHGKQPRYYGQIPNQLGNYEMIAPTPIYDAILSALNNKQQ